MKPTNQHRREMRLNKRTSKNSVARSTNK